MNRTVLALIEAEYQRYKILGERAFSQLNAEHLIAGSDHAISIATIVWHVAGNLESRFTDFLTTDGEKPWRDRESEFESSRSVAGGSRRKVGPAAGACSSTRSHSSPTTT